MDRIIYRGQASKEYMQDHSICKHGSEGVSVTTNLVITQALPSEEDIIHDIVANVKSGFSYLNCRSIGDRWHIGAKARLITNSVLTESKPRV